LLPFSQSLSSRLLSLTLKIRIYKTIILLVLYGCETWSLTLKEDWRRLIASKREEVAGGWKRLRSEEGHNYTLHRILLR